MEHLAAHQGTAIVFVKTKWGADKLANRLSREKLQADTIHGDLRQNRRDRVIQNFRDKRFRILVATDLAARGLDVPHIELVINYDLPQCPEDYIHRIGRTARAGASGKAINFVAPSDRGKWNAIHRLMNPGAPRQRDNHSGGNPNDGKKRHHEHRKHKSSFHKRKRFGKQHKGGGGGGHGQSHNPQKAA
jgi:superfamily II DNA/RNA helicase